MAKGLGGCGAIGAGQGTPDLEARPADQVLPAQPPTYERVTLPRAIVHVVTIPDPVHYPLQVAVSPDLAPVDQLAAQVCPGEGCVIAAMNAGFFDPVNGLTTAYVVKDGVVVADPTHNPRLMDNPNLTAYLEQILNRSEFRRYDCGGSPQYAITAHRQPPPAGCRLVDAVGAGPQLLPLDTSVAEGFIDRTTTP
ncbi:MAG TPA: phosphodiester glycosidase family protein, partial [Leptolyngbyaceae cyanobacterium M65_K2018_010]|nr:phosphodiester glycosidase family protein [Leptolyngbyaceae cyanobacterium M65_K2018_010]